MEPDRRKEARPFVPPAWLQRAQERRASAPSVTFKQQPNGTYRAVAIEKPPKPFTEVMADLRVGLSPPASDESPKNAALTNQRQHSRSTASPDKFYVERRDSQVQNRDQRRAKKNAVRTQRAGGTQTNVTSSSASPRSPVSLASPTSIRGEMGLQTAESSASGAAREAMLVPAHLTAVDKTYMPYRGDPPWYKEVSSFEVSELRRGRKPQELAALEALKACITRCEAEKRKVPLQELHEELRNHVHKAEITLRMNKVKAKITNILKVEYGLPRIFAEGSQFPHDLKADAFQLYNRWWKGSFDQDLLRGIVIKKGKDRNGDRIDPGYRALYPANAKVFGDDDFVLGQWWPTQLCTVRDGAHGAAQGGISGDKEHGTYSIVLSGGGYHDTDDGDSIEYSGTEGKNFTPTEATLQMITSANKKNQIRVIRSAQLNKSNKYRPERGLRYDGLYVIKDYKLVDKEKQMYRFRLERCPGQAPIRCGEDNSRRPTIFEMEEYDKLKGRV